ncbi:MAG TPA: 30S ribosomal protein S1 [Candidatus Subteraquimicrobiales bacterium]
MEDSKIKSPNKTSEVRESEVSVKPDEEYMKRDEEGKLVPDYDQTIKIFDNGDIVEGEVVKIYRDEILVDIDYKSEGVIPLEELSIQKNVNPEEIVSVGDRIEALVLEKEDLDGRLILSKKRADFERSWDKIEEVGKSGGTVKGRVIEAVKGGLILNIGLRGFLPASLVELTRVKDLKGYIGQELECKIIETNRYRNNVVLSRRAVLEESQKEMRQTILSKLEKGQILTGKISNLASFGAFVDLGGIDGLIHISELSWQRISHPSEAVSVGDEVKVQVLEVDHERGRVSLGLKQTQEDPWRKAISKYSEGDIVEGRVLRLVPFGAFVQIEDNVEGLIHISELSEERLEDPQEAVRVGDEIKVKIIEIDLEKRRLSLSLKKALAPKEKPAEKEAKAPAEKVEAKPAAKEEAQEEVKVPEPEEKAKEEVKVPEPKEEAAEAKPEKAEAKAAAEKKEVEAKAVVEKKEAEAAPAKEEVKTPKKKEAEKKTGERTLKLKDKEKEEVKEAKPGSLEAIVADMKKEQTQKKK